MFPSNCEIILDMLILTADCYVYLTNQQRMAHDPTSGLYGPGADPEIFPRGRVVEPFHDWLFIVLRPDQEYFTYMETSQLPVKGCKI